MSMPFLANLNLLAVQVDIAGQAASQQLPGAQNLSSADAGFGKFLGGILGFIMVIGSILLLIYLLWGGIDWITSGGDKGKVEAARTKMTTAVTGIIVLAATTAIMNLVQTFLGICFLKLGGKC